MEALSAAFDDHVTELRHRHRERQAAVQLRSAIDAEVAAPGDREIDGNEALGKPAPTDKFPGDARLRTLNTLLARIDQRGFERSATCHAPVRTRSDRCPRTQVQPPAAVPRGVRKERRAHLVQGQLGHELSRDHEAKRVLSLQFRSLDFVRLRQPTRPPKLD